MIFKRALQRYGTTPPPETPYSRAGQVWDERIGSARSQARNWRLMALGCLGLNCALSAGLLWQSMQSRVTPYVVAVDHLGEARAVTAAEKDYTPTDPQIAWALAKFIRNVRGVSLDPVLMRADWLEAYDFTTRRGRLFLDGYARAADPFADIGQRTVAVQVTSVVRASDKSFQIKWTETTYERGAEAGTSHWTGIVTVLVKPPVNAETLRKNPLGLYVDAVDWSREIETPQSAAITSPPPLTAQTPPAVMTPTPPVVAAPVAPINQEIQ